MAADRGDGAATSLSDEVLADSLRDFLGELATAPRTYDIRLQRRASATEHGAQRLNLGFDVGTVVREYAIVRELLFDRELRAQTRTHVAFLREGSPYPRTELQRG